MFVEFSVTSLGENLQFGLFFTQPILPKQAVSTHGLLQVSQGFKLSFILAFWANFPKNWANF